MRGLRLVAVLGAFLLTASFAQSQAPSGGGPSTPEIVQSPAPATRQSEPTPPPDVRGTDQAPITVKVLPTSKSEAEIAEEQRERHDKATTDRQLADETQKLATYTFWLFFVTLLLVLAASIQAGLFIWQLVLIRKTLGPAKEAADAAKVSADALVAAESARLLVFPKEQNYWIAAGKFASEFDKSPDMRTSTRVVAFFSFKNYGKTPAILKEASARLQYSAEPPQHLSHQPQLELPVERVIVAGSETNKFKAALKEPLSMAEAVAISRGENSIWLIGHVVYDDVFGRECTQDFLYKLHASSSQTFIRYFDKSSYRSA